MLVPKEIARPGTTTYIDEATGLPAQMTFTPKSIKYLHDQGNAMRAAGLSIPIPIEHQRDAKPMTAADRAADRLRNNAGWVEKFEIGEVKENGKVIKDVLFGVTDIKDAEIAKNLPSTIKYTSPWINSFIDGDGKKWSGVISHLALTTRPRIIKQQPFQPIEGMAAALSLVGNGNKQFIPTEISEEGISLSRAGLMVKDKGKFKPKFPMAFSLMVGAKLSEEEVKKIEEDEDEEADEKPENERESPIDKLDEEEPLMDGKKDVGIHEVIGHLLRALEMNPPDGMDKSTFERDIYETLMARLIQLKAEQKQAEEEEESEEEDEETKRVDDNPIIQESPSMYASLEEVNAIADPKERKMASMLFSLSQENAATKKKSDAIRQRILNEAKAGRDQRLEKLVKRFPVTRRDDVLAMFSTEGAKLSLDDNTGNVVDPMAKVLETLEWQAKEMFKDSAQLSEVQHPSDGTMTDARREEIMREVAQNCGGIPMVAAK